MWVIETFLDNNNLITKWFNKLFKWDKYIIVYDNDNKIFCYLTGIDDLGDALLNKYLEKLDKNKDDFKIEKVYFKSDDNFLKENKLKQLCIVDKDIMLLEDVEKLKEKNNLISDKNNSKMPWLDRFFRK